MIQITILQDQKNIIGFSCIGHAGFADPGEDVVCAGVSALVTNCINSLDYLTGTEFDLIYDDENGTGLIDVSFFELLKPEEKLLVDSMILGLQGIQNEYGNEFISLDYKEV